jgi:hypothetical protein
MEPTKYDDASWHYDGDFPKDLPDEAGGTHIAMFLAWALTSGLEGRFFTEDFPDDLQVLDKRLTTPGQFLMNSCDGKMVSDLFNDEGNAFARAYYAPMSTYVADYEEIVGAGLPSLYHAADSWETFDRFKPRIDQRFAEWRRGELPEPQGSDTQ